MKENDMLVRFRRWGHSVALRVPHSLLEEIGAVEGMSADIKVHEGNLVITPLCESPRYDLSTMVTMITKENLHGEVSIGGAVGNEFF